MSCCKPSVLDTNQMEMPPPNRQAKSLPGSQLTTFMVPTMHCANCMRKLETKLQDLTEVQQVRANLSTRQVTVVWRGCDNTVEKIEKHISLLGFDNHIVDPDTDLDAEIQNQGRHLIFCLAVAGFGAANIMLLSVSVWSGAGDETAKMFALLSGLIAVPTVFFAGSPFFSSAFKALSVGQLNMDVPISLAVLLSLFMSLYEALIGGGETFFDAGVMLLFFLLIGRKLDHLMREKAANGIKSLARMIPRKVNRLLADGSVKKVSLSEVEPGMHLQILPGDRFPVDAKVLSGNSAADRSVVTGESEHVPVLVGNAFEAGTLNISSPINVEAITDAGTSFLAEVMEMMKAADTSKGRYRRIADRMSTIYAPAVHLIALATFLGWVFFTGDFKSSLVAAIAVLIITCPCALGLAVPVTHVVAANRLFKEGILMRDGAALERLAEVDTVFFDKTGVLTTDQLKLVNPPELDEDLSAVLHTLAKHSHHPSALAIAKAYPSDNPVELADVTETAGFGIEAIWNGKRVLLGRSNWINQALGSSAIQDPGTTAFAIQDGPGFAFDFGGDLRPDAASAVTRVLSTGNAVQILSGDHNSNVADIANKVGINVWSGGLTPQDKLQKIQDCNLKQKVLMVGDGLNDAPSLAAGHASMAPASATDVSRASADLIFTRPSLLAVPFAMQLSGAANRVVRQNFAIALIYNCIAVPLAIAGQVTPLVAAIAMSLSSFVVISNSLRLTTFKLNETKAHQPSVAPAVAPLAPINAKGATT